MRTRYYIDHMKGFANQFMILAADTPERDALIERWRMEQPDARHIERISYHEARRLAVSLADYYDRTGSTVCPSMSVPQSVYSHASNSPLRGEEPARRRLFAHLADLTELYILDPDER